MAHVTDRIRAVTRPCGDIHQCKLFIDYPLSRDKMDRGSVGICLTHRHTRDDAMTHSVEWALKLAKGEYDGPEARFAQLFREWPTLFRTRLDIIDHTFFVIGNGETWLDGCVVNENPESYEENQAQKIREREVRRAKVVDGTITEIDRIYEQTEKEGEALPIGPRPDDGQPRNFYPVCEYSLILEVPDDVRDEWLAVAYEAAVLLRDRTKGWVGKDGIESQAIADKRAESNRQYGAQVIAELRERFLGRVPMEG